MLPGTGVFPALLYFVQHSPVPHFPFPSCQCFCRLSSPSAGQRQGRSQGVAGLAKATIPSKIKFKAKTIYSIYNIHTAVTALKDSVEEKRLECLMTLKIHQSDAVIDRFATIAARRLIFLI